MEGRGEGWKPYLAKVAVLAGAYYGAAKLGLDLAFASPSVTAIWAPTGISLAAVLLWGYRVWPGVALGALLANAWTGVPFYAVLGITTGNTLEALAGAYLLRELADFRPSLERVRDVIALAILGGAVSTTISATIGVTSLLVANEIASADFGSVWRTWWLGDMGGDLVVAPAILVAVTHWPYRRAPGRVPEAVALAAAALAVSAFVFSHETALIFILFPLGVWAALRFWQPGTVVGILLVASIAIPMTEADNGPFAGGSPDDRLLLAQGFLGIASITMLVMSAMTTERRRAELAVKAIAGTLQESLLPSHLPVIPGIETAVDFRAAGRRHLVGGDFYDLFRRDDESWAVIVGDVLGKGATAAATTGLARYTLRAAAVQESQPSRILRLLNDAILRQSPDQSCTVACGRIDLNSADGARVTLSVGGHPLPLVLRANGGVEQVGHPGTMLGVLPEPDLADHIADLAPGDALILYTDGLTDAYAPGRIVKRAGLVAALESCVGQSATEIASGLHEAALGGSGNAEPRDDIVLLVLRVPERRAAPPNPP
ncbi:MAG TPA: MASE1 domain-containing protein [Solirubrobacterales bacterium]|nr:MASE1 domain-containing protein [Solirubrobacterales bacterium]